MKQILKKWSEKIADWYCGRKVISSDRKWHSLSSSFDDSTYYDPPHWTAKAIQALLQLIFSLRGIQIIGAVAAAAYAVARLLGWV